MSTKTYLDKQRRPDITSSARMQLLAGVPISEQWHQLACMTTAILEGGSGPPVILLHGPGESSLWWMRVIPKLVKTHRVIVPDLPGHGATTVKDYDQLNAGHLFQWLRELINSTCSTQPTLVGHILGGAIAARFAIDHGALLQKLVLVDSLGLASFRPSPGFAFRLIRFMMKPNKKNYNRFLPHCMYDADNLRRQMGEHWEPFLTHILESARDPDSKAALRILMNRMGVPKIPSDDLARIDVPTALIWGRHDRANKLKIAETASNRYGWPLHVIEHTRDDPKLERPEAFVQALYKILPQTIEK